MSRTGGRLGIMWGMLARASGRHRVVPFALWMLGSCSVAAPPGSDQGAVRPPPARGQVALDRVVARADARPRDVLAQRVAGDASMLAALRGDLRQRERAEHYLERAYRLDPAHVSTARSLGRFLNMRASAFDFTKLDLQAEVYAGLAQHPSISEQQRFVYACFHDATRALDDYRKGRELAALRRIRRLERDLDRHLGDHPDDIDAHAMAGNYAVTFAGAIPVSQPKRLDRAIEHLEIQQQRWHELTVRAAGSVRSPNTRAVFTFMLAESLMARGRADAALPYYRRLARADPGLTNLPAHRIALAARDRLDHPSAYQGDRGLLPIWPGGVAGCVACHSTTADLDPNSLYTRGAKAPW